MADSLLSEADSFVSVADSLVSVADSLVRDLLDLETAEFDCLLERLLGHVNVSIRQHTSAYVSF